MLRFVGVLIGLLVLIGLGLTLTLGVARHDQTQNLLQRAGYGVCDQRPCFRGVGLGVDWVQAQEELMSTVRPAPWDTFQVEVNQGNLYSVLFARNNDSVIEYISTIHGDLGASIDVKLGDVLLMYGTPCQTGSMAVIDESFGTDRLVLVFPSMAVFVNVTSMQKQYPTSNVMLYPNSHITDLWIYTDGYVGNCDNAPFGLWRGFASLQRYLREERAAP